MKNGVKIALVLAGALAVTGIGMTVGGMAAGAFDEDTPGFEKNRLVQWLRRRTHDVVTVEGSEELPSDPADWEAYRARDEVDWKSFGAEEAIWRVEVEGDVLELEIRNADESLMDDSDGEQETLLPGGAQSGAAGGRELSPPWTSMRRTASCMCLWKQEPTGWGKTALRRLPSICLGERFPSWQQIWMWGLQNWRGCCSWISWICLWEPETWNLEMTQAL